MAEDRPILAQVVLPFCHALLLEPWDAPPGRYFVACRTRHGYRWLLGEGVVEEFATVSAPLFLAPEDMLGKLYDAGLALGFRRDAELPIDAGWPPLCAALDAPAPVLPDAWAAQLRDALGRVRWGPWEPSPGVRASREQAGGHAIELRRFAGRPERRVTVIASDAPLLPDQLGRLCDLDDAGLTIALATGNRLAGGTPGAAQRVAAVSDATLRELAGAVSRALSAVAAE